MAHPTLTSFTRLKDLDREILAARRTIAEQPKLVERRRADLELSKERVRKVEEETKELQAKDRLMEKEIQGYQDKIKEFERKLNDAKSNEEYAAHKQGILNVRGQIAGIEDKLLANYEIVDELNERRAKIQEEIRGEAEGVEAFAADVEQEIAHLQDALKELLAERAAVCEDVPDAHVELYDRILNKTGDTALARVADGYCEGCHTQVRPNVINLLHQGEELLTCNNCSRILYL